MMYPAGPLLGWFMASALEVPPPGFDHLTAEEQIEYVQSLWDWIAAHEAEVPVPEWHRDVLDERLADLEADPEGGRPWEEVEADLLRRPPEK
jgi:putative addiction module component (TIGR02574 family)